ncbi:hypothetical protein G7Y89_g6043 [Cudoniella acicularis]|uniref:Major facilitator superfamily (MFS) profile domain-containing protein n=1 Tax=Cudoniella acicularis TaxID=354080 RepID=A0A8H4W3E2_9HELO|nr:hypothetical protein G7Y89_g6043 [Cudoniella acicularis]
MSSAGESQERKEALESTILPTQNDCGIQQLNYNGSLTSADKRPGKDDLNPTAFEPPSEQQQPAPSTVHTDVAYSIFTHNQKKFIILTASLAAFFSPLNSQIYLPALNEIAADLNVSASKINLTMTTYMILQGLAPTMIAGFSESAGRRPAYLICFTIYIAANIGLALQNNYAALLVLRMVQSAGSSGTVALSNGVVADIVTSAERGIYIGYASVGGILGPAIGPPIGGLLSKFLGWKWIFWFLTIFSASVFIPLLFFFPETCRKVVGDGSIPPPPLNDSLASYLERRKLAREGREVHYTGPPEGYKVSFPNPFSTLAIIADREAALLLFCNGFVVACLIAVTTGIPSQFAAIYHFNTLQLSLVFLPFSFGSLLSAFTTGKAIDWNYRRYAKALGYPLKKNRQLDLTNFPIERARMEVALPLFYLGAAAMIAYGWVLHYETNLAGPLILLFVMGWAFLAAYQSLNILLVDMHPGRGATVTAASNLFRCLLSAGASAVVVPMIEAMGRGWTYTFAAAVWLLFSPVLFLLIRWGPGWRKEKKAKADRLKAEKEEEKKEAMEAESSQVVYNENSIKQQE